MSDRQFLYASGVVQGEVLVATITVERLRDAMEAYALRDELISLLDSSNARSVVIDMGKIHYTGTVLFLAFLGVRWHLGDARIVLCNLSEPVREMFAISRMIPSETPNPKPAPFEVAPTLPDALARLTAIATCSDSLESGSGG